VDVTFCLPHLFEASSTEVENAQGLRLLLESVVALNRAFLRRHSVPALYRSGVVYRRTLIWDTTPALYIRKFGDCKSLAPALIAEYRQQGIECEPTFRSVPPEIHKNPKYDGSLYHILVTLKQKTPYAVLGPDGRYYEDPSKVLGMTWDFNPKYFQGSR
jgi:hypothetical protein